MQGLGFTDDVTEADVQAIVSAVQNRVGELDRFALQLGPADADPQGVPLAVRPWEPVISLRRAVRQGIGDVWGAARVPEPADGFRAHVTISYSNSAADPGPLREALAKLRGVPPVETTVRHVSLIRLNRDQKTYVWETVARAALR